MLSLDYNLVLAIAHVSCIVADTSDSGGGVQRANKLLVLLRYIAYDYLIHIYEYAVV